jgi:hypothetical protein
MNPPNTRTDAPLILVVDNVADARPLALDDPERRLARWRRCPSATAPPRRRWRHERADLVPPSHREHQLTVIRAFLRHRLSLVELIDLFDAEAKAHRFTLDPGRTTTRTLLAPAALLEDRALPALLTETLVVTMTRAGARPMTLTAKGSVLAMVAGISS